VKTSLVPRLRFADAVEEEINQVGDAGSGCAALLDGESDRRHDTHEIADGDVLSNRPRLLGPLEQPASFFTAGAAARRPFL